MATFSWEVEAAAGSGNFVDGACGKGCVSGATGSWSVVVVGSGVVVVVDIPIIAANSASISASSSMVRLDTLAPTSMSFISCSSSFCSWISSMRFKTSSTVVSSCIRWRVSFPSFMAARTKTSFCFESIVWTICITLRSCASTDSTSFVLSLRIFSRLRAALVFPSTLAFLARARILASSVSSLVLYFWRRSLAFLRSRVARSVAEMVGGGPLFRAVEAVVVFAASLLEKPPIVLIE
mmetsp:Transcript_25500/g.52331  ORF Transcript_25500/g.52331 Transcript_25500/m.52331 type:complete len:237 (+) Transcript_25500:2145-2855(+)